MKQVEIPEGVKKIGNYAFSNCCELEEIILPKSLENISHNAFRGCDKLKKIINKSDIDLDNSFFEEIPESLLIINDKTLDDIIEDCSIDKKDTNIKYNDMIENR